MPEFLFLIKLQAEACNFIKKETLAQVSPCGFCEISKNTFFTEHLWAAASGYHKYSFMLITFINRNSQYVLFKSRTVKTSASYILSRIFSAFGIRKDFGIVLAFSFQKPQHKRIEQSRFFTGVIGLEYGLSLCSIMPFSSNPSNYLKIPL